MPAKARLQRTATLAIVGLLVLVAQPAAVLDAPVRSASQAPEAGEAGCPLLDRVVDELPVEEASIDAEIVADTPDAEACLEEDASLGELEQVLGEVGLP